MAKILFNIGASASVIGLYIANRTNDVAWILTSGFMFVGLAILILGERLKDKNA